MVLRTVFTSAEIFSLGIPRNNLNWRVKILPQILVERKVQRALSVCLVEVGNDRKRSTRTGRYHYAFIEHEKALLLTSNSRCGWLEHFSEGNCGRGWPLEQSPWQLRFPASLSFHFSFLPITVLSPGQMLGPKSECPRTVIVECDNVSTSYAV
jgi:hypothetical protein